MAGNKKPKKKYVPKEIGKVPAHFLGKLTEEEHRKLKLPPHQSLVEMEKQQSTPTDWYNVTFRILHTLILARTIYVQDVVDALQSGYDLCVRLRLRFIEQKSDLWVPSTEERLELLSCVEAADEVQHDAGRVHQIQAYREAYVIMKQYLKTN